ncbi:hypothetical protein HK097_003351 [Rhizophlyctis rosea]|uniref:Uncharacterized protein n=1 Tax=Rhizophlyctis rosea TaxID=64517 RepID=A0AAD5WXY0_9FUNG|nr:hypothetical protein HK097_003351 [Rhizophlyctis rosea]
MIVIGKGTTHPRNGEQRNVMGAFRLHCHSRHIRGTFCDGRIVLERKRLVRRRVKVDSDTVDMIITERSKEYRLKLDVVFDEAVNLSDELTTRRLSTTYPTFRPILAYRKSKRLISLETDESVVPVKFDASECEIPLTLTGNIMIGTNETGTTVLHVRQFEFDKQNGKPPMMFNIPVPDDPETRSEVSFNETLAVYVLH